MNGGTYQRARYRVPCSDGKEHEFVLKPTSINNRKAASKFLRDFQNEVASIEDALRTNQLREALLARREDGEEIDEIPEEVEVPEFDEIDFWFRMFCTLTDGPHHLLVREDFDAQLGVFCQRDFLLPSTRTAVSALEFLS